MKVLVTGAGGFVGREVVRQLHEAGHVVRGLSRSIASALPRDASNDTPDERVPGDILKADSLTAALSGCDAVINLVGIISEVGKNTFENVHVNGTRNLVAGTQSAGIKRFIQMSAMGTRPKAVARYHQTKWLAEEFVRTSGLDYTIIRPSIIYGAHDHFVNLFANLSRFSAVLPVMGSGKGKLQPIAVEDVATCFVRALGEPRSIGKTYELGGTEQFEFNQILDAILRVTGRKRFKLHLPMPLARMQASAMELVAGLMGKPSPLTRDQLLMLQEDNVADSSPAWEMFKLKPVKFEAGISAYL